MALSSVIGADAALAQPNLAGIITLTGAYSLSLNNVNQNLVFIDPGGASRNVTLWPEADTVGVVVEIVNYADAAETITLKDGSGNTVGTIAQNKAAKVANISGQWFKIYDVTIAH
jgi:hypothetical protein